MADPHRTRQRHIARTVTSLGDIDEAAERPLSNEAHVTEHFSLRKDDGMYTSSWYLLTKSCCLGRIFGAPGEVFESFLQSIQGRVVKIHCSRDVTSDNVTEMQTLGHSFVPDATQGENYTI